MRVFRTGFTVIELAMVCVIVGLVSMMAYPRVSALRASANLRAAKQTTAEMLARARAAAVQRGWRSSVVRSGDALRVIADSSGSTVVLVPFYDLYAANQVHLSPAPTRDTIGFDPRGYGVGLSSLQVIRFSRADATDSLCVSRLGKVEWGCSL